MGLAIRFRFRRWKEGVVPYKIDDSVKDKTTVIEDALEDIESQSNVDFVSTSGRSGDYILFTKSPTEDSSSSKIGNALGLQQKIKLASWASRGTVIHEVLHALGVLHEHQRPDRNDYVKIRWFKIKKFWHWGNFIRFFGIIVKSIGKYDFASIMHYSSKAFGDEKTIIRRDGKRIPYQRRRLSKGDIETLKWLYP